MLLRERERLIKLLEDGYSKLRDAYYKVEEMQAASNNQQMLVRDLISLAETENDNFQLHNEYFDLLDTITMAFRVVRHTALKKEVQLIGPHLPRSKQLYFRRVLGDQQRYLQFLVNFLSKAIEHSPEKEQVSVHLQLCDDPQSIHSSAVTPTLHKSSENSLSVRSSDRIRSSRSEAQTESRAFNLTFEITIRDRGKAISEEERAGLARKFGRFGDVQKPNQESFGLGLSICKEIIEKHMRDKINVKRGEGGRGNDFVVSIETQSRVNAQSLNEIRET